MPRVLSLRQASAKTIVCALCHKCNIKNDDFFNLLPLPLNIKDKLKNCCSDNAISDVIYRIMACNIWLESIGNYHEGYVRSYRVALENMLYDLLPFVLKKNGF